MSAAPSNVGVVVIGRNEGARLVRCFESLRSQSCTIVYVDSGSSDDSVNHARSLGIEVVDLDLTIPFTAARARNAGFRRLRQLDAGAPYVQFVDGDCEMIDGWLERASEFLSAHDDVACVCGRLRERFPERSVYNRMCDREWDRPSGAVDACGGIALIRGEPFARVDGFNESLVAGEEAELCQRLRAQGFAVWRLPDDMAWHDANIVRFGQWWKRSKRVGFAYAQSASLHGRQAVPGERVRLLRPWLWTVAVPLGILLALALWGSTAWALLLAYPASIARAATRGSGPATLRLAHASFLMLAKVPELLGQCQFWSRNAKGSASSVRFDYKS